MAPMEVESAAAAAPATVESQSMPLQRALIGMRITQIACAVVLCIFSGLGSAASVWIGAVYDYWDPLGISLMIFFMSCLTLALSITWLVFTAAPPRRQAARACCGPTACTWYTCDLAWDIVLALFWLAMLILSAITNSVGTAVVSGVLHALLVTSAGLSGKIQALHKEAAAKKGPASGEQVV